MAQQSLTPETFLAVTEMVAAHLRIKEADRWSPHICRLKFHSFTTEFPEVNETQFMWAAEQWIQGCGPGFTRYPTWKELMAALYRTENGLANRSWGFRSELPAFLAPTVEQLMMLPGKAASIATATDPTNAAAYVPFVTTEHPLLPPAADAPETLTEEWWQEYLAHCHEARHQSKRASEDSGAGPEERPVERVPVQRARVRTGSTKRGVP